MFNFFKRKDTFKNPEEKFWNWFAMNKTKIEKFMDSEHRDYSIYNKLTVEIQKYNAGLFPELTKDQDDKYVLIITPDGMKEGVEPTKKLAAECPAIDNWVIVKFRQPSDHIVLNFKGLEYPATDIQTLPQIDHERELVDIDVFIRNMNKDEGLYQSLAFLYLDHILGEFNSIMKVGFIDFHHLDENKTVENSISLLELRNLIAENLY
jgi:hypothetical protein